MIDAGPASTVAPVTVSALPTVIAILGFPYVALLGIRSLRRASTAGLGASLLLAAIFGVLAWSGVEVDLPITVANDAEDAHRVVDVPLLRTLAELCGASAIAGFVVRAIDLWLVMRGHEPLLRLQRSVVWLALVIVGVGVVYELHFVANLPIRTAILSIGGASVFIVGLALQSTLGNVFAGYSLQAGNVFRKGDTVQLGRDGVVGSIYDSTLSTTRILTRDGELLVLPHGSLLGKDFMNLDRPVPRLRQTVRVGIAYDVPPAIVKDVALQVLAAEPNVLREPEPHVWLLDFADSSVTYALQFWIPSYQERDETLDRVRTRLWYALHEAGIEIPFPMRTVRMVDRAEDHERRVAGQGRLGRAEDVLRACPLFADHAISSAERRELAQAATECTFRAGEAVVRRGERSDAMFVVAKGSCDVLLPSGDRVALGPGAHFGEIALVLREPRTADVVASDGAVLLRLPRQSVMPVLSRKPEFATRVQTIAEERREATLGEGVPRAAPRRANLLRALLDLFRPI